MSFPRYPKYKPSGVEWLGDVPEHWELAKIKHIARIAGGGTPSRERPEFWNGDIPWVSPKDMKTERIVESEECITHLGLHNSTTCLVPVGRLLMVIRSGILQHTLPVAINDCAVALNQDLKAFEFCEERCLTEFFFRWVQGLNDQLLMAWASEGATVESLNQTLLRESMLGLPPVAEQIAIAHFLDRETSKIDSLVAEQRRLIELLKEKRQAVISHAVTKGLNPNAPMKPSGIEWLGDVPQHWQVTSVKRLAASTKAGPFGSSLTKDMYVTSGFRVYGQEQVIPNDFRIGDYFITESKFEELSQYRVVPGDVLISCVGTFGKIAVVPAGCHPGIINPRLLRLRCTEDVTPEYIAVVLRSLVTFEQFTLLSRGGTMDVINIGILNEIRVAVPPRDEQDLINHFLDTETAKLDTLTAEAERAIELLQERRTALISAAVTGRIDVRGLA